MDFSTDLLVIKKHEFLKLHYWRSCSLNYTEQQRSQDFALRYAKIIYIARIKTRHFFFNLPQLIQIKQIAFDAVQFATVYCTHSPTISTRSFCSKRTSWTPSRESGILCLFIMDWCRYTLTSISILLLFLLKCKSDHISLEWWSLRDPFRCGGTWEHSVILTRQNSTVKLRVPQGSLLATLATV